MVESEGVGQDYVPAASGPSAANAAAVITLEERTGARIQLGSLSLSYSAAPAGGRVTIADTGGPRFDLDVVGAGPYDPTFPDDGITFEAGQPVTITLAPGGAAVIGKVNVCYRYVYHR